MNDPLTEEKLKDRFFEAVEYPSFIDTQNEYELKKLLKYTSKLLNIAAQNASGRAASASNEDYPKGYNEYEKFRFQLEFNTLYPTVIKVRRLLQRRLEEILDTNEESRLIKKGDIFYKYWYYRNDEGLKVYPAIEELLHWLKTKGMDSKKIKKKFDITIDLVKHDSFRKLAGQYKKYYYERKNEE